MAMATVNRRWTIATWMVARLDDRLDAAVRALEQIGADAIALQSIGEADTVDLAAALGVHHAWARSHHPRSRLLPGSAVGLAVVTPHRITGGHDLILGDPRSLWSSQRRVAQTVVIARADQSAYAVAHATERLDEAALPTGSAPLVRIRPAQVGIDDSRALQVPLGATTLAALSETPLDGIAPLLAVTFEMPWVQGDFPTP
jgi:hypothetical protein